MSKKVIAKLENLTHQEWLELRRTGIGGSDCAAALGMSKWQSQLGLWLDKMGQGKPVEESEAMYWGKVMEPVLLAEFSKRTGKDAQPCPLMFQRRRGYSRDLVSLAWRIPTSITEAGCRI